MTVLRARTLSFTSKPDGEDHAGVDYREDTILIIENGVIQKKCTPKQYAAEGGKLENVTRLFGLLVPGFVDCHIHYPQMDIIGSHGTQLLDWLDRYAFPAEQAYHSKAYAQLRAQAFVDLLCRYGTTTALTFTTIHPHATDALFEAVAAVNARWIAGKVLMDRNAPAALCDTDSGDQANRALIERWHGQDRLSYALTPRFAITCSDAQLAAAGALAQEVDGLYVQSHISEHPDEVQETMKLFPDRAHYTDVYEHFGLLGERSIFAHGIHLSEPELARFEATGSKIAFCPTSNLFLGSGLLDLERLDAHGVGYGAASDVGGGTSFSMLTTLAEGYKVCQMNGHNWHPLTALYTATRGGAQTLSCADRIGSIEAGMEADFVLLNPPEDSWLAGRLEKTNTLTEEVFACIMLGGENAVARTWIAGEEVYNRDAT